MNGKQNLQKNFEIMYKGLLNAVAQYLGHGHAASKIDEIEAYLVATIHALMDYADRFLQDDESILACRYVNNTIKHADGFVTHKEVTGGFSFPITFPLEIEEIKIVWKRCAELECRYKNQKDAYQNCFAGKPLIETLQPIADMIRNGVENK